LRIALVSFVTEDFDLRESKTKHPPLRSSHPQHRFSRKQDPKEQSDFSSYTISYPRILKKNLSSLLLYHHCKRRARIFSRFFGCKTNSEKDLEHLLEINAPIDMIRQKT